MGMGLGTSLRRIYAFISIFAQNKPLGYDERALSQQPALWQTYTKTADQFVRMPFQHGQTNTPSFSKCPGGYNGGNPRQDI